MRLADNTLGTDITMGIQESKTAKNFKITQMDVNFNKTLFINALTNLPPTVRGVLLLPIDDPEMVAAIQGVIARGIQVIQLDRSLDSISAPAITFDNFSGAVMATRHLQEELKLPVFYLGDYKNPDCMAKRFQGWQTAMLEHGHINYKKYVIPGFEDGIPSESKENSNFFYYPDLKAFLESRKGKKTAIFAAHDFFALAVYNCAKELGMRVGKDIFVVGFDDLELCKTLSPQLSSIKVPRKQLGSEALNLLSEIIETGNNLTSSIRKILPVSLEVRASSQIN
ncbi:MAG: substrate-binding domain-containing protein [Victivallales bacterium]